MGSRKRVRMSRGIRALGVRADEVGLYSRASYKRHLRNNVLHKHVTWIIIDMHHTVK